MNLLALVVLACGPYGDALSSTEFAGVAPATDVIVIRTRTVYTEDGDPTEVWRFLRGGRVELVHARDWVSGSGSGLPPALLEKWVEPADYAARVDRLLAP